MGTLTLTKGASSITIKTPEYGYTSTAVMGLHYSRVHGGYKIGDDTSTYDHRICEIPTWLLGAADQLELSEFFVNMSKGRGEDIVMGLGAGSGFFPFLPDKGDAGNFTVSLVDHKKGGVLHSPYLYHENALTFALVTPPAYTPGAAEDEGSLQIGTVTTLRHPQRPTAPLNEQQIVRALSRAGVVSSVDLGTTVDLYEADIDLVMKRGNCAALITYLLTARGGDIQVITPANTYLFGIDQGSSGTYTTKLITNQIKVVHESTNKFQTTLRFAMVSKDA